MFETSDIPIVFDIDGPHVPPVSQGVPPVWLVVAGVQVCKSTLTKKIGHIPAMQAEFLQMTWFGGIYVRSLFILG
jgi:hypothetical protein